MSLEVEIRQRMVSALKAGNKAEKDVYTGILTALTNKAKELQAELTEAQDIEVITKLAKQNKESIDTCPENRKDILDKLNFERNIIMEFMPKQMSEDEITDTIRKVLAKLGMEFIGPKDKGKVMKELMPLVKGKADGKLVNRLLENFSN